MNNQRSPLQGLISLIITVAIIAAVLYVGFYVARSVFYILSWMAPVLLVIALILDYKVVLNYGKWLIKLLTSNTLYGIIICLLTIFFFPVVAGWLCFKAVLSWQLKKKFPQNKPSGLDEYAEYEEVDSEIHEEDVIEETYDTDSTQ